jgi:hypothetical protein
MSGVPFFVKNTISLSGNNQLDVAHDEEYHPRCDLDQELQTTWQWWCNF